MLNIATKPAAIAVLLIGAVLPAAPASAQIMVRGAVGIAGYPDFGLHFFGRDLTVDYAEADGGRSEIETQAYGLSFYEPLSDTFKLGVLGGRLDVSQSGRATTLGMTLAGYYVAFAAKAELPILDRLSLRASANLAYADVDGSTDEQTSSLDWNELNATAEIWVRLLPSLRLMAGSGWTRLDGNETSFGVLDVNHDFEIDDASMQRLGLEFIVDRSGFVGLTFEQGASDSFMLYFQRAFR